MDAAHVFVIPCKSDTIAEKEWRLPTPKQKPPQRRQGWVKQNKSICGRAILTVFCCTFYTEMYLVFLAMISDGCKRSSLTKVKTHLCQCLVHSVFFPFHKTNQLYRIVQKDSFAVRSQNPVLVCFDLGAQRWWWGRSNPTKSNSTICILGKLILLALRSIASYSMLCILHAYNSSVSTCLVVSDHSEDSNFWNNLPLGVENDLVACLEECENWHLQSIYLIPSHSIANSVSVLPQGLKLHPQRTTLGGQMVNKEC